MVMSDDEKMIKCDSMTTSDAIRAQVRSDFDKILAKHAPFKIYLEDMDDEKYKETLSQNMWWSIIDNPLLTLSSPLLSFNPIDTINSILDNIKTRSRKKKLLEQLVCC